ncbi:protein AATF [Sitophilus oryzae]|uniref:Protein AATF n=1 Tax=Sitophilus oryzae TaxID=7048 RepID=A0A6J2XRD0_SITOR|nr:protein AATF [Sitophilus oryzae]
MSNKRSNETLASKIAGILSAAPTQFNPDDDHIDDTSAKLTNFDDYSDDESEEILSKFRKQNIDLLGDIDQKYAGKKSNRKSLKESSDEYSASEEWDTEDDVAEEDGKQINSDSEEEDSQQESENSDDEENGTESDGSEVASDADENFQHIKETNESQQVKKGVSVRNQMKIWESLLEARIQLQKCLSAANKLPQGEYYRDMIKESDLEMDFKSKIVDTKKNVENVLDKLLLLQKIVIKKYPETKKLGKDNQKEHIKEDDDDDEDIPSDTDEEINENESESETDDDSEPKKKKRKFNDFEVDIAEMHEKYKSYRNETIEKWNAKTRLSITKNAGQVHSVLNQIDHILNDKAKLRKRTQLKRTEFKILGEEEKELNNEDSENARQPEEYNTEIFDDSDFYHQLLRELIEVKSADITDPVQLGRQWIQLQNLRNKMKRKIDTKATKGRKIRYTVHSKLVNFMAPLYQETWTDEAKNELYSSLFGKIKLKNS